MILLVIIAVAMISMAISVHKLAVEMEANNSLLNPQTINNYNSIESSTVQIEKVENIEKIEGNGHAIGDYNTIENKA